VRLSTARGSVAAQRKAAARRCPVLPDQQALAAATAAECAPFPVMRCARFFGKKPREPQRGSARRGQLLAGRIRRAPAPLWALTLKLSMAHPDRRGALKQASKRGIPRELEYARSRARGGDAIDERENAKLVTRL
jgi:hypothetical protein